MNDMTQGQHKELTAEQQWEQFSELKTAEDYINSLRGRNLDVFLLGERIEEPVDHPIIRPSINAMAERTSSLRRTQTSRPRGHPSPSSRSIASSTYPSPLKTLFKRTKCNAEWVSLRAHVFNVARDWTH